jgi:hypothetical protein
MLRIVLKSHIIVNYLKLENKIKPSNQDTLKIKLRLINNLYSIINE